MSKKWYITLILGIIVFIIGRLLGGGSDQGSFVGDILIILGVVLFATGLVQGIIKLVKKA